MMFNYGDAPEFLGMYDFDLTEFMHYQYLPAQMWFDGTLRLPDNVKCCRPMIIDAISNARKMGRVYEYAYLTARKGWATPDNPINRPGWHCDGFGTEDMNYIWWTGPGTRFAVQKFTDISDDDILSMHQFEEQIDPDMIQCYPVKGLYALHTGVVHATPIVPPPGCMRQFVKISLSDRKYNLIDNSHNYLFDYEWAMVDRNILRNNPYTAQKDFA